MLKFQMVFLLKFLSSLLVTAVELLAVQQLTQLAYRDVTHRLELLEIYYNQQRPVVRVNVNRSET